MHRTRLLAVTVCAGLLLTAPAGVALAEGTSPSASPSASSSPSSSPSGTGTSSDSGTGSGPSGDPSASPSSDPSSSPSATGSTGTGTSASTADEPSATGSSSASAAVDNQPPVTQPDAASLYKNSSVTVDVLGNDSDPDGDPLTLTGVTGSSMAKVSGNEVVFTSGTTTGTFPLTYTVTDGNGGEATGDLDVTVKEDPPRSVEFHVPGPIVALRHYTARGRVLPTIWGTPEVALQRRTPNGWVTINHHKTRPAGYFTFDYHTNWPHPVVLRAKATWPGGRTMGSHTRRRNVVVRADAHVSGPLTARDVPWSYRSGCPVAPKYLRKVTINRMDYRHHVARGTLVVRGFTAKSLVTVFTAAVNDRFPVKSMNPTDVYYANGTRTPTESDEAAMRAGNTAAFNCRPVTGNPYRVSQHSYGNAIDINTIQNPYVTGSRVYPSFAGEYLDRSPYRMGMILRGGVIARQMADHGWPWGARWSHPDYQHFSSNGG